MNYSYWEKQHYNLENSIVIIGGGISGISTALSLVDQGCKESIIIIDRTLPPSGGSTKNAGFLCYGSPSELLEDLSQMTYEDTLCLLKMRIKGAELLTKRIPDLITITGGYEYFENGQSLSKNQFHKVENLYREAFKTNSYASHTDCPNSNFDSKAVILPSEGMIDPMQMMLRLRAKAQSLGIKFINAPVDRIEDGVINMHGAHHSYRKLIICTNGFTSNLLPHVNVTAVRNQVLITKPIKGLPYRGVYHYKGGYYYWRSVGNRLLLGGARTLDSDGETTDIFGVNNLIIDHLTTFYSKLLPQFSVDDIEHQWSGILGVGSHRFPIIEKAEGINNCFIGVKLGGMGVAIGSHIGSKLADLVTSYD